MIRSIRIFILVAAASLIVASMIHLEVIMDGYGHREAGVAEAVIAVGMLVGLGFTWRAGRAGLRAGVASLAFGLLGTLVGAFTIIIGVGPQTTADFIYHAALILILLVGLILGTRALSNQKGVTSKEDNSA